MLDFYADAYFAGLWGHEDPQDPICARSITVFVVTFSNFPLLWVSKLQTEIALSTLYSEYVALSHSVRALLPLKIIIEEVIDNLGIDSEKLKFVSSSNIYEDNKRSHSCGNKSNDESYIKAHCCRVSLVQAARWKIICDSED